MNIDGALPLVVRLAGQAGIGGFAGMLKAGRRGARTIKLATQGDANRMMPTIMGVIHDMNCEKFGMAGAPRDKAPPVRLVRRHHADTPAFWDCKSVVIDQAYWDAFPRRRLRMLCHEGWHAAGFKHRMGIDYERHERMAAEVARPVRGHQPRRRFDDPYFAAPSEGDDGDAVTEEPARPAQGPRPRRRPKRARSEAPSDQEVAEEDAAAGLGALFG